VHPALRILGPARVTASYLTCDFDVTKSQQGDMAQGQDCPCSSLGCTVTCAKVDSPLMTPNNRTPLPDPSCAMRRWVLPDKEYAAELVGPKALKLERLARLLPACIQVPRSFAVPYSALPRALEASGVPVACLEVPSGSTWQRSRPEDVISYVAEVCTPACTPVPVSAYDLYHLDHPCEHTLACLRYQVDHLSCC
jgi:hypothetical protein